MNKTVLLIISLIAETIGIFILCFTIGWLPTLGIGFFMFGNNIASKHL